MKSEIPAIQKQSFRFVTEWWKDLLGEEEGVEIGHCLEYTMVQHVIQILEEAARKSGTEEGQIEQPAAKQPAPETAKKPPKRKRRRRTRKKKEETE